MSTTNLRLMLSSETSRIINLSEHWQNILENSEIPDDASGKIRAHIGLSRLLVNDKLQQFESLMNTYEAGNPDVPRKMTLSDLEGFWDLVYLQIEGTLKKYHDLQVLRENNWTEVRRANDAILTPRRRLPLVSIDNATPGSASKKANGKNYSEEARHRLAEAKLRLKQAAIQDVDLAASSTVASQVAGASSQDTKENLSMDNYRQGSDQDLRK